MTIGTPRIDPCPVTPVARRVTRVRRRGLSTLEFVLALPILLFLMALMINYGTVASWKVRCLTISRHAMWASRDQRNGGLATNPRPANWPNAAHIGHNTPGQGANPVRIESLADPRVDLPIARGATITVPRPWPLTPVIVVVNRDMLDPTLGLHVGSASLEREFPLMRALGTYHLTSRPQILNNTSHFRTVREDSISWYHYRDVLRMEALYDLPRADGIYGQRYVQAIRTLLTARCWPRLRPLDRDPELLAAARRHPFMGIRTDFHPVFQRRPATLDKDEVYRRVERLIDRISRVPDDMDEAFRKLYAGEYD